MVSVSLVAPVMRPLLVKFTPFSCHWKFNGALPSAVTLKTALLPEMIAKFVGGMLIEGGNSTVRVATWLVAELKELATTAS